VKRRTPNFKRRANPDRALRCGLCDNAFPQMFERVINGQTVILCSVSWACRR
jgi:hypothetical protein